MSAIFNLFDIQNHHFRFHHPSFMSQSNPQQSNLDLQGVEAPRNSLQSPESVVEVTPPPPSKLKEQTNFNIPPKAETAPVHQTPLAKAVVRDEKCKRIASERYDLRLKKKIHPQEEVFVNKISKKKSTPLPNHAVNVMNTTKFLSFKKEMTSSSSSTTRLPQKQVSLVSMTQLPSSLNSSYNSNNTHTLLKLSVMDSNSATSSPSATTGQLFSDHFVNDYISRIINHCGINTTTTQWYSPSHPLHPSIFHHLEKQSHSTTTATATAGRRMIFELMRSFPAAHCEVLEDIDGLIERDMGRQLLSTAFEEEAEEIVREIEGEIVETMVHEMVLTARSDRVRSHVLFT
ncbi:hypothetical protein L6452_05092 [Arctium lappa]|uniref:Uncharacterized protein n=1 Tax=Arctium lappa TaxID=4217 RepID=A0ACB9EFF6_ARCLA|nr:hypothetical protein L6452_05092 [Arctium lappa]